MPSKKLPKRLPGHSGNPGEKVIRGREVGLPMVETVGAIHSLSASRITWHSHQRYELLLLLRGATAYEFQGRHHVELVGEQFLVVPPGTAHRGFQDVRMPSVLCGIVFDPGHAAARNSPFSVRELAWMARQLESQPLAAQPMSSELRRMVHSLSQLIRRYPRSAPTHPVAASIRLLVCSVILEAARQSTGAKMLPSTEAAGAAISHMEAHFSEPLQMNDVVNQAGCSRARLFEVFKRETGMSPNDWLQRYRIRKAGELLAATNRSINDVALSAGFSSSQYFSNVFRKYTGMTPGEHRKRMKGV